MILADVRHGDCSLQIYQPIELCISRLWSILTNTHLDAHMMWFVFQSTSQCKMHVRSTSNTSKELDSFTTAILMNKSLFLPFPSLNSVVAMQKLKMEIILSIFLNLDNLEQVMFVTLIFTQATEIPIRSNPIPFILPF